MLIIVVSTPSALLTTALLVAGKNLHFLIQLLAIEQPHLNILTSLALDSYLVIPFNRN